MLSLVPVSDSSSSVSNIFFLPVTSPLTQLQPGEGCSMPLPCQGCHSSTLFALMASEAEEASQGFRSVHGCHVSFCLIHVKVIPSTSAFSYAICWFLRYNSTCWDPNCHHISHQGTENFTGYFLCLCTVGVFLLISIENYYSLLFIYVSLVCILVCSQAIFIICSFPSGPHVAFVYIGLHIEGDIIHPCTSKVRVCVHASSLLHSSLHVCAACSCLCYTKMSQCCGLFFRTQHISVCMLILLCTLMI